MAERAQIRWHIVVFLAPAVLVYTAVMIFPLFNTLRLALYSKIDQERVFVGLENFQRLFGDPVWSEQFWNALGNNFWFFLIHMLVQNPIGIALAAILSHPRLRFAALYRSAIFVPTILSFVIVGFAWKLILSPIWGIAPFHAGCGRTEILVRAVAGQGRVCADDARPRFGVAVRGHPDDADLRRPFVDTRRDSGSGRGRWHHRTRQRSGRSSCR